MNISNALHIYTDGASRGNPGKAGAGVVIRDASGIIAEKSFYLGHTTNNVAEYSALILGLKEAQRLRSPVVFLYTDSELLAKQITGSYKVKDEKLRVLFNEAKKLLSTFIQYDITHISRSENKEADRLANAAIDQKNTTRGRSAAVRIV